MKSHCTLSLQINRNADECELTTQPLIKTFSLDAQLANYPNNKFSSTMRNKWWPTKVYFPIH